MNWTLAQFLQTLKHKSVPDLKWTRQQFMEEFVPGISLELDRFFLPVTEKYSVLSYPVPTDPMMGHSDQVTGDE